LRGGRVLVVQSQAIDTAQLVESIHAHDQGYRPLQVKSPEQRARLHEAIIPDVNAIRTTPAGDDDPVQRRMFEGGSHLLSTLREAPILIFVCGSSLVPGDPREDRYQYAAIYGATQNMLVAGRALGLGVAPTGIHNLTSRGAREMLNVPEHKIIGVTMAVGRGAARPRMLRSRCNFHGLVHFAGSGPIHLREHTTGGRIDDIKPACLVR
jgi:nitroreductase